MSVPSAPDVDRFWREGYLRLSRVFSADEIATLRDVVAKKLATREELFGTLPSGVRHLRSDLLADPDARAILLDGRVLAVARALLGGSLVYFGDSTLQVGTGERGWHRDNRLPDRFDPSGLDWDGRYPLIRFGLYLQDHARHSGGLGIRVGSHLWQRAPGRPIPPSSGLWSKIRRRRVVRSARTFGRPIFVDTEVGDLAIWTLRTTHSGNSVRLRALPRLRLPPRVEELCPRWLAVPESESRMAFFFTLAAVHPHTERYVEYLATRDYAVEMWRRSKYDDAARDACARAGVALREVDPAKLPRGAATSARA